jgi:transcriptional regulator with XRE-family HTH domain
MEEWRTRLRDALQERRWAYKALSLKAGLSEKYVSMVLRGATNPTVSNLEKICSTAGIKISDLFAESDAEVSTVDQTIEKVKDLSEEEARLVSRLIDSVRD